MTTGFGPVDRGSNPRPGAQKHLGLVRITAGISGGHLYGGHGGRGPALDLPVQIRTAPDFDSQASAVVAASVLTYRRWVVPLEDRAPELNRRAMLETCGSAGK